MMNDSDLGTLAEDEYWHGTRSAISALSILYDGFRLSGPLAAVHRDWGRGGLYREGVYLTKTASVARQFGQVLFKCRLASGTRLLHISGTYHPDVIAYLTREFGREILSSSFGTAIPDNKHLTTQELVHLVNYLWKQDDQRSIDDWIDNLTFIRQQVVQHKFQGMGDDTGVCGLVIFDPARVAAERIVGLNFDILVPFEPRDLAWHAQQELNGHRGARSVLPAATLDHVEQLLARLRAEHDIA